MKTITSLLLTAAVAGSLCVAPFASAQTKPAMKPAPASESAPAKKIKAHTAKKTKTHAKRAMSSRKPAAHSAPSGTDKKK